MTSPFSGLSYAVMHVPTGISFNGIYSIPEYGVTCTRCPVSYTRRMFGPATVVSAWLSNSQLWRNSTSCPLVVCACARDAAIVTAAPRGSRQVSFFCFLCAERPNCFPACVKGVSSSTSSTLSLTSDAFRF